MNSVLYTWWLAFPGGGGILLMLFWRALTSVSPVCILKLFFLCMCYLSPPQRPHCVARRGTKKARAGVGGGEDDV